MTTFISPNHSTPSEEPLYNIGVVARMTDIPVATLRVWERRYDFPKSSRTSGGHRLYSEKEILRLRWVKSYIDEGMQTKRAIQALRHKEKDQSLSVLPPTSQPQHSPFPEIHTDTSLDNITQHFTDALLNNDTETANQILGEALALYPLENLLLAMIQPTLNTIGQAWVDNHISIATEHLATAFIRNRLLLWMLTGPPSQQTAPIILTCAPDEWHEISLLIFGVLLRRQGWPVVYLGQALPLPDLATFLENRSASAVVIIAMREETAQNLAEWPAYFEKITPSKRPPICYAGRVFVEDPQWRERVSGIFLGETIEAGMNTLNNLLSHR